MGPSGTIFFRFTPLVEPLSLDEAFLDVTGSEGLFGPAVEIGRRIKQEIWSEVRLVASVGVAPNRFLAKIASDLQKPDALVVVDPAGVQDFLDPLPVGRLWGVGQVTGEVFERLGVRTVGELRRLNPEMLRRHFGSQGEHFWKLAHGIDERRVVPDREATSISHETTFSADIVDREALRAWFLELTEHVGRRLRRHRLRGRTIQLKLRFADFQTITRSRTLPDPKSTTHDLWTVAAGLLDGSLPEPNPGVRLLGVGMSGFEDRIQRSLFEPDEPQKRTQLDAVADEIQAKFGSAALNRGNGLLHGAQHRPAPWPSHSESASEGRQP